jgi:hypothetical protein
MGSKAQQAALMVLRRQETHLMQNVRNFGIDKISEEIQGISGIVREYGLEKKIVVEIVKSVYGLLMDGERYAEAATLAKRYRL